MKKTFFTALFAVMAILITSCSSDPFVGKWVPDNDLSGKSITQFNSDGTAELIGDADDGTYHMDGTWSHVEGSENTITLKYDSSTAKVDLDNPLAEQIVMMALQEAGATTQTLTLSDDGKRLTADGGNGYFVRY